MPRRSSLSLALLLTSALIFHAASARAATEKIIYTFTGSQQSAWGPVSKLVLDSSGRLFGNTQHGGDGGCSCGAVFELSAPNSKGIRTYMELYGFHGGNDGILPIGDVVMDAAGNLYGVAQQGGANLDGIAFSLTPAVSGKWTETILHTFSLNPDGANPGSGLTLDAAGNLYGVMGEGGAKQSGTVYHLLKNADGSWTEKILSDLGSGAANPAAAITIGPGRNIYGAGWGGGQYGLGTVFEVSPKSGVQILFNFPDPNLGYPSAQLWRDATGNLYGTAIGYSVYDSGAAYELVHNADGSWTENTLHTFGQTTGDGYYPESGLTPDSAGNLYGTTANGGAYGLGTVYKLTRGSNGTWTYSIVYSFGATSNDGSGPVGGLTIGPGNKLYGTTYGGGKNFHGTVFEIIQ